MKEGIPEVVDGSPFRAIREQEQTWRCPPREMERLLGPLVFERSRSRSLENFTATTCASARDGETRDVIVSAVLNQD